MKIETKFGIGDRVWTLDSNHKAVEFEIKSVSTSVCNDERLDYVRYSDGSILEPNRIEREENEIFASKDELRGYVFGD